MEMIANSIAMNTYSGVTIESRFRSEFNANTNFHMLAYFWDTKNAVGIIYFFITPARLEDNSRAAISCGVESSPWTDKSGTDGPEFDNGKLHHMVSTLNDTNITLL